MARNKKLNSRSYAKIWLDFDQGAINKFTFSLETCNLSIGFGSNTNHGASLDGVPRGSADTP